MLKIETGAPAQAVLQGAKHVLFVEGTKDGLDVTVLGELLSPKLRVEPLGASFSIRSAASALHAFHPEYWFVIDRDDWDEDVVEKSWSTFPDPSHDNLLIWRRKELESYFLEPDWLMKSAYAMSKASRPKLKKWIEDRASEIVLLAAANRVLVSHRNRVKRSAGELLKEGDVQGLDRAAVEEKLVAAPLLQALRDSASEGLTEATIRSAFNTECEVLMSGKFPLEFDQGLWRQLMPAKAMFRNLVSTWMRVPDLAKGGTARLTGRAAERAVAVDLLKNQQTDAPADLLQLKSLLDTLT
jgi:hypothetical protein